MTQPGHSFGISIKKRHPDWLRIYPQRSFEWMDWHTRIIKHGPLLGAQIAPKVMQDLYRTDTIHTPAAHALLDFEIRTMFDRLPPQTHMHKTVLADLGRLLLNKGRNLWAEGSMVAHHDKHMQGEEGDDLNKVALVLHQQARALGFPQPVLLEFFPRKIQTPEDYGNLPIAIFAVATREMQHRFPFYLYTTRPPESYTIAINIEVPLSLLEAHQVECWRVVRAGFTVAVPNPVEGSKGTLTLPRLLQEIRIATVHAATQALVSQQTTGGRLCRLHLS